MKRAHFTAPARREFLAEVVYYNSEESGVGMRFAAAVEEATMRAMAFPLTGSPASKNTRRMFVKNFPFAIVYREQAEGIVIFCDCSSRASPGVLAAARSREITITSKS